MTQVSLILPRGSFHMMHVAGTHRMLQWANEESMRLQRVPLFTLELVGCTMDPPETDSPFQASLQRTVEDVHGTDLILIPAIRGDVSLALERNKELISWIRFQHVRGADIAAFGRGAFLLAATGLLNGRPCTTHGSCESEMMTRFPQVRLHIGSVVTESNGLYTCGGGFAFANLLVHLIRVHGNRDVALRTAKEFLVQMDRVSQAPSLVFSPPADHGDPLVADVQTHLETHLSEKHFTNRLADRHGISRRTLERRFRSATGYSLLEYLQRVRIEEAKRLLESGSDDLREVMNRCGYRDPKAFRETFRRVAWVGPLVYRARYGWASEDRETS